jgi:hypothetical protein
MSIRRPKGCCQSGSQWLSTCAVLALVPVAATTRRARLEVTAPAVSLQLLAPPEAAPPLSLELAMEWSAGARMEAPGSSGASARRPPRAVPDRQPSVSRLRQLHHAWDQALGLERVQQLERMTQAPVGSQSRRGPDRLRRTLQREDDRDALPRGGGDLDLARPQQRLTPAAIRHLKPRRRGAATAKSSAGEPGRLRTVVGPAVAGGFDAGGLPYAGLRPSVSVADPDGRQAGCAPSSQAPRSPSRGAWRLAIRLRPKTAG